MLTFRAVLRGSIARFLPASLISIAALLVGLGMPLTAFATDPYPLWSAKMAVALTAGYLAGLEIVRRLAPAVAGIDGWRSLVAGLAAPLPYLLVGSLGSPFNPPWGPLQALDGWVCAGPPWPLWRTCRGGLDGRGFARNRRTGASASRLDTSMWGSDAMSI